MWLPGCRIFQVRCCFITKLSVILAAPSYRGHPVSKSHERQHVCCFFLDFYKLMLNGNIKHALVFRANWRQTQISCPGPYVSRHLCNSSHISLTRNHEAKRIVWLVFLPTMSLCTVHAASSPSERKTSHPEGLEHNIGAYWAIRLKFPTLAMHEHLLIQIQTNMICWLEMTVLNAAGLGSSQIRAKCYSQSAS